MARAAAKDITDFLKVEVVDLFTEDKAIGTQQAYRCREGRWIPNVYGPRRENTRSKDSASSCADSRGKSIRRNLTFSMPLSRLAS